MTTPEALFTAAIAQFEGGDSAAAAELLRGAIQADPGNAVYHFQLGNIYWHERELSQAVACFREAQRLDPNIADFPLRLGVECARSGMLEQAEGCLRLALSFGSDNPPALACLGDVLRRSGREAEALEYLEAAARLAPESPDILLNLGIAQCQADRLEQAVATLEEALRLNPASALVRNSLGMALKQLGRLEESMLQLNEAVRIAPDFAEARLNRAMALLLSGDFAQGWSEYRWRPKRAITPMRPLEDALRAGLALEGKTVLLHAEQGLGDLIQFVRYAAWIEQRGAKVIVECPEAAQELIRTARGVADVTPTGALPQFDLNAYLLSLPGLIHPGQALLPFDIPYLSVDPRRVRFWKERIGGDGRLRVGLVWAGSPANTNDRRRSMPFAELEPILRHPGVAAFSLQAGPHAADLVSEPGVPDLGTEASGLAETAAAMMCLDLIISVDTMPAHLAGSLGRPVWVLLPFVPDWRWLLDREDTPWYPAARLFRQPAPGDWKSVVRLAAEQLNGFTPGASRICRDS